MKLKLIAIVVCALVAISSANLCPVSINDQYRQDEATNLEYFSFPSFYNGQYPFSVSANQHPEFQLLFTQNNIQLFSYIGSNGDFQIAVFCDGQISNSQQHWTSDFHAFGIFSPFGLRTSPDFKWVTLTDINMCGRTDNNYRFNISISYADFWSDSPADAIWSTKSVERSPIGYCSHEQLQAGGCNYVLSKGFWIEFIFDWGRLNFNVPANIPGYIFKDTILDFWDHCECDVPTK